MDLSKIKLEARNKNENTFKDVDVNTNSKPIFTKQRIKVSGGVPTLDVVLSIRHFATLLKSSLPIEEVLQTVIDQTINPKLKKVYTQILADVLNGQRIAASMETYPRIFPRIVISIIRAGEEGGTLEKNLLYLADYLKKNYKIKKKLQAAMFYPIMIIGLTILELIGVVFFILPQLDALFSTFPNVPDFTKNLLAGVKYVNTNWPYFVGGVMIIIIIIVIYFKTRVGSITADWLKLNSPVIKSLTVDSTLTNFARTLSILLESTIPLTKSLEISAKSAENYYYGKALNTINEKVKTGQSLSKSLAEFPKMFPMTFVKMIEVGEKTGTLEEDLIYMHEFYDEEVNDISNNIATLVEPILLVFIGIIVALLAISIIVPIYQLTSSINS